MSTALIILGAAMLFAAGAAIGIATKSHSDCNGPHRVIAAQDHALTAKDQQIKAQETLISELQRTVDLQDQYIKQLERQPKEGSNL